VTQRYKSPRWRYNISRLRLKLLKRLSQTWHGGIRQSVTWFDGDSSSQVC